MSGTTNHNVQRTVNVGIIEYARPKIKLQVGIGVGAKPAVLYE